VFLLTAGLASLVWGGTRALAAVAAGVLFGAAYLTKQSALPSVILFLGYLVLRRPRTGLPVALTFVLLVGASTAWLARSTDNWYTYYTLKIATGYSVLFARLPYFWIRYVGPLAVSALLGALWLMWRGRERRDTSELLAVGLANIALASWWLSLYPGTAHNVAIPAAMVLAILLGLGTGTVLRLARDLAPDTGRRLESITYLACAIQLVALGYDPAKLVPTSQDVAAGRQLVRFLATRDGDVLVPNHSYLARMAGKPPHYHSMALANTLHNDRSGSVLVAAREIQRALDSGHYGTIVLDASNRGMLDAVPGYGPERALFRDPDVFMTRVGERTRPEFARTRIAPALAR
jgi:hypothetical protein